MQTRNPFASAALAIGYARSRPPLHSKIVERLVACPAWRGPVGVALDLGCGAGLSTIPLAGIAHRVIGIDPAIAMASGAAASVRTGSFAAAAAEALPFRDASFGLVTAAGSLNYAAPERAFAEIERVLARGGLLAAYDFTAGRSFPSGAQLDTWFAEFSTRYPWPRGDAIELDPESIARLASGFVLRHSERFEIALPMTRAAYTDYMMTETNVAQAIARGTTADEIRAWCDESLARFWQDEPREVLFRGYLAVLEAGVLKRSSTPA